MSCLEIWQMSLHDSSRLVVYRIAGIYREALNVANFAIWDALAKIKVSTHFWIWHSKIANISSESKIV